MRALHFRPSPQMRRRLALAAASQDVQVYLLCQRVLNAWLLDPDRVPVGAAPEENGPYHALRFPTSDHAHQIARALAASMDISRSTLVIRVLHAFVPYEVEILAEAMTQPPPSSPRATPRQPPVAAGDTPETPDAADDDATEPAPPSPT